MPVSLYGIKDDKIVYKTWVDSIDKEKQIRGFYDGTNSEDINRLLKDIEILKQSYVK